MTAIQSAAGGVGSDVLDKSEVARIVTEVEEVGLAVVPGVLSSSAAAEALAHLWEAVAEADQRGAGTHRPDLDPNSSNVRLSNLLDLDLYFAELITHPFSEQVLSELLVPEYILSSFTANVARPGSRSMMFHNDQSSIAPEPWTARQSVNIIWCLTDATPANGATVYLPGSHHYTTRAEGPSDPIAQMIPFEAEAGSIVVMDGRTWHTSGSNVTEAEDRALVLAFHSMPFIRPMINFHAALSPDKVNEISGTLRSRLCLDWHAEDAVVDPFLDG